MNMKTHGLWRFAVIWIAMLCLMLPAPIFAQESTETVFKQEELDQLLAPIALYPDECWFCGTCVEDCPVPGAIQLEHPLNQRVGWKRKESGEYFRVGMKNPPPPNQRPPVS